MKNLIASISAVAITLLAAPVMAQSNMDKGMDKGMSKGMEKPKAKKKSDKMSQGGMDKMDKKDGMAKDKMAK